MKPQKAHFTALVGSRYDASGIEYESRESNRYPIHLRGSMCRSEQEVFSEFAAAFQFPWYFGYNLDALAECLFDYFTEDLRYQSDRVGLDVLIWDADRVLEGGRGVRGQIDLENLISILTSMEKEIRSPTGIIVGLKQVSRDVRFYLHFETEEAESGISRWEAAGCYPIARRELDS